MFILAALLSISAWHGHDLPTATPSAVKYRLRIAAKPGTLVHLRTSGVSTGWIAAFCDNRVCSPAQLTEKIPKSGVAVVQFELIREGEGAPRRTRVVVRASDAESLVVSS